jgi:hypothetical protein
LDTFNEKNISIGALVRIRVHGAKRYLGIVVERIWHGNTKKIGYTVYLMELETRIMMFDNEFEVLSDKVS